MAKLTLHHGEQVVTVSTEQGENILDAARRSGVQLESPCNGNGTCGKCRVKIVSAAGERAFVLACQTPVEHDLVVETHARDDGHNLQIKQDGIAAAVEIDSMIRKIYRPDAHITEVYRGCERFACEEGDTSQQIYGLAVDIGTTTIVVALVDLRTGQELAAAGALNPQSRLAQDVLSRIRYASNEQGLAEMHRLVIDEINRLAERTVQDAAVSISHIYDLVLSGNSCMQHLATNINPASLGQYPYIPVSRGGEALPAGVFGIRAATGAAVYLPPIISAYVGADITAGIIASRLGESQGITLFIDIGTNGEMVLAADGVLTATSTAAGPAFEGMNISCGMRAAPGAIEAFQLTPEGEKIVKTIGGQSAIGICGSGLLDIVSELVRHGLVGKNGKFTKTAPAELGNLLVETAGKPAFAIAERVFLSQQDVRQVQLAKGAIRAGIEALLDQQGLSAADVDRVLIAGSFGYHLNPESLIGIGLLPDAFRNKIEFLGNTSKTGSQVFLLSQAARQNIGQVVTDVSVLELATVEKFDRLFVKCLDF